MTLRFTKHAPVSPGAGLRTGVERFCYTARHQTAAMYTDNLLRFARHLGMLNQ
jgi:hypothetical protein